MMDVNLIVFNDSRQAASDPLNVAASDRSMQYDHEYP